MEPLGIRSLRATSGRQASEVIRTTPIHIAFVDLGLPLEDTGLGEGGQRVLEIISRLQEPPPTVVITRGRTTREDTREISAALRVGAFAVLERPRTTGDLEILLSVMRRILERFYHGRWPGTAPA